MVLLSDQDSNLNRQNQNLQCYRYTIGQRDFECAKLYKKPCLQNPHLYPLSGLPVVTKAHASAGRYPAPGLITLY
jgi:hypothetical protein